MVPFFSRAKLALSTRILYKQSPAPMQGSVDLAICAIIKNETPYLNEWLDFHLGQGVSRFYIYNNNSDDNPREFLADYIKKGIVDVFDWKPHPAQLAAYKHCIIHRQNEAKWIAFLDIDEFLFAVDGTPLPEFLNQFKPYPAVAVHWRMFGTSGHILKPHGGTLENFTRCQKDAHNHMKVVMQPSRFREFLNPHIATYDAGMAVNEDFQPVGSFENTPTFERIRINHYWTRSVEEWVRHRMQRGQADVVHTSKRIETLFHAEQLNNEIEDTSILDLQRAVTTG